MVDLQTGYPTVTTQLMFQKFREYILSCNRVIPCSASGTNVITLTPNDASPLIESYMDYEIFAFVAANNSTGTITMTVVPKTGALDTLPVYIDGGSTAAGAGDVTAGRVYLAVFVDSVNSGNGGFVLK
jgi:hypothetical protein